MRRSLHTSTACWTGWIRSLGELTLNVEADGPDDGLPVVCIHGVTASAEEFGWLVPRLVAEGHRVVRFDLRGHGDGDSDRAERYPGPGFVTDALAVLEQGVQRPSSVSTWCGRRWSSIPA